MKGARDETLVGLSMAVRLFLTSGEQRIVSADGARLEDPFFIVTRWLPHLQSSYTVVTLRAQDVVRADIEQEGVVIEQVRGAGRTKEI